MRSLLVYLLLFAVLLPGISPWGTIAYYNLNRDYIARVLCENRDRPELHCDGQCYLAKKLKAQQDRQDKETSERVRNTPVVQLFCEAGTSFSFAPLTVLTDATGLFTYKRSVATYLVDELLRPPRR
ncbi:hypothetical protein [uncultured Spirosoma sp.]|uniref:hypothetical protein n=1 Tax=uncultured Spirosoma sp. TaxID=278208 RepID=UPI0025826379|nr:hypothetical protein [uncultured Spirosoma sp.]